MTDPRPSENQDGPLKLPEMRRRGFFDDVPTGDDFFGADEQPSLGWETADAQHIVAALDRLTEQQRVANLIAWTTRDGYRPTTEVQAQIEMAWGRIAKIAEENGEVTAAFIGATGQNPRKGITHTLDDVRAELLDVAVTALGAYEHINGHTGGALRALDRHIIGVAARAGVIGGDQS